MNDGEGKIYLVFKSTRDTILMERECKAKGYRCIAVPIPREYSSQCGIALEISETNMDEILDFIKNSKRKFHIFDKNSPKIENYSNICKR